MEPTLPVSELDFSAITVLAHFAWAPTAAGGVDTNALGNSAGQSSRVVSAAHAAGKKVVITVGGANSATAFRAAMSPNNRAGFVSAVVSTMNAYGYDGVDIDMEPLDEADAGLYVPFVQALRAALPPGKLLTAAMTWKSAVFAPVAGLFDQLNQMTYDMAGAYPGWVTWHNSALSSNGLTFPGSSRLLPSCADTTDTAVAAGAPREKLGIGIDFYGYVWSGATGPNQSVAGVTVTPNVAYSALMDTYDSPEARRWHDGVDAPYLSTQGRFISYDDEQSIARKIDWVRANGLGGVIVWELGGGYRPNQPPGQRDVLLQAVKHAAFP
jgi:chitinase